jgi:glycosyltransferase involved in cell wall biosynthesis
VREGEVVVGHLANQSREKGTVDLLLAAARVWERREPLRLVLAGPEMPNFRSFWAGHRPGGPVLRLGVLDDQGKRDFFAGLDVFALPSRSDSFGLVLLEAWANQKPNVGYRAGGVAEVIRHGEDGLLVPCGDVAGLASALSGLTQDANLRAHFGQQGYGRTLREFAWVPKVAQVREDYRRLARARAHAVGTDPPGHPV